MRDTESDCASQILKRYMSRELRERWTKDERDVEVLYNHMSHTQVELTLCAQKQKKIINSMAILLFLFTQS